MNPNGTGSPTEGLLSARERLRRAVRQAGGAAAAAKLLGCSRAYVDMLVVGSRVRPGMQVAFEIERRLGIPMQIWMAEAEVVAGGLGDGLGE